MKCSHLPRNWKTSIYRKFLRPKRQCCRQYESSVYVKALNQYYGAHLGTVYVLRVLINSEDHMREIFFSQFWL